MRRRETAEWSRLFSAGALAIGGFGRSRWLFAADAVGLWDLLLFLKTTSRDCLSLPGWQMGRAAHEECEPGDVASVGGGRECADWCRKASETQ